jgi:hypothetical protein
MDDTFRLGMTAISTFAICVLLLYAAVVQWWH